MRIAIDFAEDNSSEKTKADTKLLKQHICYGHVVDMPG